MALPTVEADRIDGAVADAVNRYVALLHEDLDPDARAVGDWTVADVATHVRLVADWFSGMLAGEPSPFTQLEGFAERSQELLDAFDGDRALPALADGTATRLEAVLADMAAGPADREIVWHAGIQLPVTSLAAVLLAELLVHGYDIATVHGQSWPIDPAHAALVFAGLLPLLPHYVDEVAATDVRATFEVRIDGLDPVRLHFDDGALTVSPPDGAPPDCRITARPAPFMLAAYGRIHPLRPGLTGKVRAGGRKPWLALSFNRLLRNP